MCDFREPVYDDYQLDLIEEQNTELLIEQLVERIVILCDTAANLRMEVNTVTHRLNPRAPPVYYEPYSDLCQSFEDHPAYARFEKQLARLIYG
jgi:hypothetical protein